MPSTLSRPLFCSFDVGAVSMAVVMVAGMVRQLFLFILCAIAEVSFTGGSSIAQCGIRSRDSFVRISTLIQPKDIDRIITLI